MPIPNGNPITHPCAWRGEELLARADWEHQLTPDQIAEIEAGAQSPHCETLFADLARHA